MSISHLWIIAIVFGLSSVYSVIIKNWNIFGISLVITFFSIFGLVWKLAW